MAFSSLKVSVGLTARALTIDNLVFSWISRSKSGMAGSTTAGLLLAARRSLLAVLATVSPCDDESENEVQRAESGAEHDVSPRQADRRRQAAEEHEADAHQRDNSDGERAAADERRAVEQQPKSGNGVEAAAVSQGEGQHCSGNQRREIADEEAPRRAGHE